MLPLSWLNSFWLALQFLTRLPTPSNIDYSAPEWGKSAIWFPLIGMIIGIVLWGLSWAISGSNMLFQAALITVLWVAITGALHLDGLADSVDAWVGGMGSREKTLIIMKDPTSGPMAMSALILVLMLKLTAVYALIETQQAAWLIVIPLMARTQLLLLFLTTQYATTTGMGKAMQDQLPRAIAWWVASITLLGCAFISVSVAIALALSLLLFIYYRQQWLKRIQGFTGDVAGAWVEISEMVLICALILVS
jgi:adenosylcobinamide-GDP ribazoletransferase